MPEQISPEMKGALEWATKMNDALDGAPSTLATGYLNEKTRADILEEELADEKNERLCDNEFWTDVKNGYNKDHEACVPIFKHKTLVNLTLDHERSLAKCRAELSKSAPPTNLEACDVDACRLLDKAETHIEELGADRAKLAAYCRDHGEISTGKLAQYLGWSYSDVVAVDTLRHHNERLRAVVQDARELRDFVRDKYEMFGPTLNDWKCPIHKKMSAHLDELVEEA